jgi:hypothetical protein
MAKRYLSRTALVVAWLLAVVGVFAVALSPVEASLRYAILWAGVVAVARGLSWFSSWAAVALDLSLLFACLLGLEIGGLFVVPGILSFLVSDVLSPDGAAAG